MRIIKGDYIRLNCDDEVEAILFVNDGLYYYVESGIVENELRVLGNWETAKRVGVPCWGISMMQGNCISQELGDYLVANQEVSFRIGAWLSAAMDDPNVCLAMKIDITSWLNTVSLQSTPNQNDDKASSSSGNSED